MHAIRTPFVFGTAILLALGCASATDEAASEDVSILTDSLGAELSPVSRAMVLANRAAEHELNLILRVQTRPGALLEVYEPSPGQLIYSGGGSRETSVASPLKTEAERHAAAIDAALTGATSSNAEAAARDGSADTLSGSLVEVLARLAPRSLELPEVEAAVGRERARFQVHGMEPPGRSLAEARQLVREVLEQAEVAAAQEPRAPEEVVAPIHTRRGDYRGGFCDEEYFTERRSDYPLGVPGGCIDGYDQTRCRNDVEDGTHSASKQDAQLGHANACAAYGTVTLSVKWRDNESNWMVEKNFFRWYQASDLLCIAVWDDCPYFRSEVNRATGSDRYHWRHYVVQGSPI